MQNDMDSQIEGRARILGRNPLTILISPITSDRRLGLAANIGARLGQTAVVFLVTNWWQAEKKQQAEKKVKDAREHIARFPKQRIIFLANTQREAEVLREAGGEAHFFNRNMFVSEETYRPIPHSAPEFDAVYNARPVRWKRHELCAEIDRVLYLTYIGSANPNVDEVRTVTEELLARAPRHQIVNPISGGIPKWINHSAVNEALSAASVGLCLSEIEGQMVASMEYLLAGLPIVSTPSEGGRDVYFDSDYCVVADPNPRSIRDAVTALTARKIPRDYVRTRTLARVRLDRQRFLALVDGIAEEFGQPRAFRTDWPKGEWVIELMWHKLEKHMRDILSGVA